MKNTKIQVSLKQELDSSYTISIGESISCEIASFVSQVNPSSLAIITDSNLVSSAESLANEFEKEEINTSLISFPAGESSKTLATLESVLEQMLSHKLDRKSCVVAFGGGVTGDLAGFAASVFMRGISVVQVPTSLLAMVDSSVGGKTGVDFKQGKNLAGSFLQPKAVFADVSYLKTLPYSEIKNGLAESVKHAVMFDSSLFSMIRNNSSQFNLFDANIFSELVEKNCIIKSALVEKDEFENSNRVLLNYGHTVGHAIESLTGYSKVSHGEAVAIGMAVEGRIAVEKGFFSEADLNLQNSLLKSLDFSLKLPKISRTSLVESMKSDKKSTGGNIKIVFPEKIGKYSPESLSNSSIVSEKEILSALQVF